MKYQISKKIILQNRLYIWLLVVTACLSLFARANKDLFIFNKEAEIANKEFSAAKDISQGDLIKIIESDKTLSGIFSVTFLLGGLLLIIGIYFSIRIFKAIFRDITSIFSCKYKYIAWTTADLIKVSIIIILFINILYVIDPVFFMVSGIKPIDLFMRMILKSFAVDLFALATVIYFVSKKHLSGFTSLGLNLKKLRHNFLIGAEYYIGFLPYFVAVILLSVFIAGVFNYQPHPQVIFGFFFHRQANFFLIFLIFFITVLGPMIEEIFFRGFCYPALRNTIGPAKATLFVSAIFALLHMNMIGFFPIFILGLLLTYLYEKTNSLVSSITVHILHNSLVLYFVFLYRLVIK